MKIHNTLGKRFKEIVQKDAPEVELRNNDIPFEREKTFNINYEGIILKHGFDPEFFVFNAIILEIKAVSQLYADAFRQTLNYFKTSQIKPGLLINFGTD